MEKKKLKLTISGKSKKTINNIEIAKSKGKNSVIIEKKTGQFSSKSSFSRNNNQKISFKSRSSIVPKVPVFSKPPLTNDFEKRK